MSPHNLIAAHHLDRIVGGRVELVPYEQQYVPLYHSWLQDPHIQEMTATEPLDLQTEYDYQKELAHSTDRFTKLIQDKESGELVGDINVFFQSDQDSAEINIMIAQSSSRQKGYASEALMLVMVYCVQKYNVGRFFVKVLKKNQTALNFFGKHGFTQKGEVDAFGEVLLEISADNLPRTELHIQSTKYA